MQKNKASILLSVIIVTTFVALLLIGWNRRISIAHEIITEREEFYRSI
jgi:hypothetical protein